MRYHRRLAGEEDTIPAEILNDTGDNVIKSYTMICNKVLQTLDWLGDGITSINSVIAKERQSDAMFEL